jgi:hypothetical protein
MGQAYAAAEAVEERDAERCLQLLDLLRERRLGDVFLFGGADETAGARDR